ncbi:MAG: hypothetical protein JNM17_15370 [Archangium sp.]|nr:hypothetical protein [Archangium sp.]
MKLKPSAVIAIVAVIGVWMAWPADPQAWRRAEPSELLHRPRWNFFIVALRKGDDEALSRVLALLPLIKGGDHLEEELHGALIESLAVNTARTLDVIRAAGLPLNTLCYEGTRKTRQQLAALVDAGFGETALTCLTVMSTRGSP